MTRLLLLFWVMGCTDASVTKVEEGDDLDEGSGETSVGEEGDAPPTVTLVESVPCDPYVEDCEDECDPYTEDCDDICDCEDPYDDDCEPEECDEECDPYTEDCDDLCDCEDPYDDDCEPEECDEDEEDEGCTLTQGFWKNHPEDWPVDSLTLGGEQYTQAQALALWDLPVEGDASINLAHQLMAAKLNLLDGAVDDDIEAVIEDADEWIDDNCSGALPCDVHPSTDEGAEAIDLAGQLATFNEGNADLPHCDDEEPTYTVWAF